MASLWKGSAAKFDNEEAASVHIGYFDHRFEAVLLHFSAEMRITLSDGATGAEQEELRRNVTLTCKQEYIELAEKVGTGVNERERAVLSLPFKDIASITWDHQHSGAKVTTHRKAFLTALVENSLELEQNLSLR